MSAPELPVAPRRRAWLRWLEGLLALGLVLWVGWLLVDQLRGLGHVQLQLAPWPCLASLLAGLLASSLFAWLHTAAVFRAAGHPLGPASLLLLANLPRLGKYVPGKVHAALGLIWLARRREGVPPAVSTALALIMLAQGTVVALWAAAVLLPWSSLGALARLGILAGAAVVSALLHPRLLTGPLTWALSRLGLPPLAWRLPTGRAAGLCLGLTGLHVVRALAFAWLVGSLLDLPPGVWIDVALAFVLAVLSGVLVLFAPAGLGVQEGAMLLLLAPSLPPEQAALVTLAARAWTTAIDLLLALAATPALAVKRAGG